MKYSLLNLKSEYAKIRAWLYNTKFFVVDQIVSDKFSNFKSARVTLSSCTLFSFVRDTLCWFLCNVSENMGIVSYALPASSSDSSTTQSTTTYATRRMYAASGFRCLLRYKGVESNNRIRMTYQNTRSYELN